MISDGPIRAASGLYRLLLYLYPAAFRREFGREMALIFRDTSRMEMERGGPTAMMSVWITFMWDLIATALVERLRQVTNMSTSSFTRFAGLGGVLAGLILIFSTILILSLVLTSPDLVQQVLFISPPSPQFQLQVHAGNIVGAISGQQIQVFPPPLQWYYLMALGAAWMIVVTAALFAQGGFNAAARRALLPVAVGLALVAGSGIFTVGAGPGRGATFVSVSALGLLIQGLSIAGFGRALRVKSESPAWGRAFVVAGLVMALFLPVSLLMVLYPVFGGFGYNPEMPGGMSALVYGSALIAQGIAWALLGGLAFLRDGKESGSLIQAAG